MGVISDYVKQAKDEIAASYQQGGVPRAAGTALRKTAGAIIPAAQVAYDQVRTGAADALSPIFNLAEGAAGVQPGGLAPSSSPVQPPSNATLRGTSGAPAGAPVPAPTVFQGGKASAEPSQGNVTTPAVQTNLPARRVSISVAPDEEVPSLQPIAPPSATDTILGMLNDGTWSGMINARALAKRTDADRAASVAQQGADNSTANAVSGRIAANANAANAVTNAGKEQAQVGLITEQAKAAQAEAVKRQQVDALTREMVDPSTKPERRKEIERLLVAVHGKNPTAPTMHASPIFDALGQKVGERLYERQADGGWKDVTPKVALKDNAQAMAVVHDDKMSETEKRAKLQAMGYQ
jgi:hypothetical protein